MVNVLRTSLSLGTLSIPFRMLLWSRPPRMARGAGLSIPFRMLRIICGSTNEEVRRVFQFLLGCYTPKCLKGILTQYLVFQFLLGCYLTHSSLRFSSEPQLSIPFRMLRRCRSKTVYHAYCLSIPFRMLPSSKRVREVPEYFIVFQFLLGCYLLSCTMLASCYFALSIPFRMLLHRRRVPLPVQARLLSIPFRMLLITLLLLVMNVYLSIPFRMLLYRILYFLGVVRHVFQFLLGCYRLLAYLKVGVRENFQFLLGCYGRGRAT